MLPPLFEWASSRLTWITLPIWIWVIAAVVARLVAALRRRRVKSGPVWRWTFVGSIAWAVIGALLVYLGFPG